VACPFFSAPPFVHGQGNQHWLLSGIFLIETKHYQGWIFDGANQNEWTQVIFKKKSRFQNPVRQNYGHLKTLQSLFMAYSVGRI
jgi:hypothetical protein